MRRLWGSGKRSRPWLAMAVAYAFALQTMLMVAVGAQNAAHAAFSTDPAVICFGVSNAPVADDDGTAAQRLHQTHCVACAFAAAPAPEPASVSFTVTPVATVEYKPLDRVVTASPPDTPRMSQGPPQIA